MIYAVAGMLIEALAFGLIILSLVRQGRDERRELELKLLAVCNPPAAVHVESIQKGPTGSTHYMDDAEMVRREKATK